MKSTESNISICLKSNGTIFVHLCFYVCFVFYLLTGGIPICWPQFSDLGSLEQQHGFARNTQFSLVEYRGNFARLRLSQDVSNDGNIFNKEFPHSFDLDMDIFLEDYTLKQTLRVKNTSSDSNESGNTMAFTSALHTYFSLKEGIEAASIEGLEGTKYLDSLQGRREIIEENKVICFQGEVDRIYCNTPNTITLKDGKERSFVIQKTNFSDAVIWNPAIEKSAKMNDFGDDDWKRMVCIEVAQAGSGRVELLPGQTWEASQSITLKTKDRN